ncbi:hypothetical protein R5W23_002334 [Gemmata sp. JC673]|uniref:Carboxypeptidase regulatory-like domain-containing protein n=1 Tax=Gemmata algarum TaxID=2975278 RepID=A0ABU5F2Y4_9BACT|nr:hypothetical protein [Gemmata algarum]MDY3561075.1 hypothetical protein [Gemmata algarum]
MRATVAALVMAGVMGCGGPKAADAPGPVRTHGRAVSGGKPAAGAVLVFHAVGGTGGGLPPRARAGPDGRFAVTSADGGDGMPEGEYAVTVEWRSGSGENGDDGRSLVSERYTRPATTPLKVTVRRGPDGRCALPDFILTP